MAGIDGTEGSGRDPERGSGDFGFGFDGIPQEPLFGDRLFTALEKADPLAGSLLISAPDGGQDIFQRSIVYLLSHDAQGSAGVILNQKSDIAVESVMPNWVELCSPPAALYLGGPVGQDSAVILGVARPGVSQGELEAVYPVADRVCIVDVDSDLEQIAPVVQGIRIFAGYAGWEPGQLHDEIERGDWYVAPSLADDILAPARIDVWAQVLRRQPLPLPLYATFPLSTADN